MLEVFLEAKPLYYDEIDYTRMPRVYDRVKEKLNTPKIIHIIGTNGKGTTGRFLATALYNLGYRVGHYTSPHIIDFNERIWIDGKNVSNEELDTAHLKLLKILTKEESDSLSYFEYTTLLAIYMFENLDYIVLEAGLGGENDATTVFDKSLTLITPIAIDHEAFLGNTIVEIATTKLKAVQNRAIIAKQKFSDVYRVAEKLSTSNIKMQDLEVFLDERDYVKIENISKELELVPYLKKNLMLSIAALKFLNIDYDERSFQNSKLFGRLTAFKENILLDVGHNTLAAKSILSALSGKKYVLIYNSYSDKNYKEILDILKPITKKIEIIDIKDSRIETAELLKGAITHLDIEFSSYNSIESSENYLVFGSFKVVEEFLRSYHE